MLAVAHMDWDTAILFVVRLFVPVAALFAAYEYSQTPKGGPARWHVVPLRVSWAVVFAAVANGTLAVGIIVGWWSPTGNLMVRSLYATSFAATIFGGAVIARMQRHYLRHIRRCQQAQIDTLNERLEEISRELVR